MASPWRRAVTLRLRLVGALGLLLALGLGGFGAGTYAAYRSSQYRRLDDQLRSNSAPITRALLQAAGLESAAGPGGRGAPGRGAPQFFVPVGWYGQLRDARGTVLAASDNDTVPDLPPSLPVEEAFFTTGSVTSGPRLAGAGGGHARSEGCGRARGDPDDRGGGLARPARVDRSVGRRRPHRRVVDGLVVRAPPRPPPARAHGELVASDQRWRSLPTGLARPTVAPRSVSSAWPSTPCSTRSSRPSAPGPRPRRSFASSSLMPPTSSGRH